MSAKQVLVWTRQRNATRTNAKRETGILRQLVAAATDRSAISVSINKIKHYREQLAQLDQSLLLEVDEEQLDAAVAEADHLEQFLTDAILVAEQFLITSAEAQPSAAQVQPQAQIPAGGQPVIAMKTAKLPELHLITFYGDTLQWQTFWDTFNAVVHSKPMSAVEKFQYLKNSLGGEAARLVDGYAPTEASYDAVRAALVERYDNKDLCIFAHLDGMISMTAANGEVGDLQRVYDECEAHIRGLVVLGMGEDTFGKVFTNVILSKLPRFIRVELYRKNGTTSWTLDNLRRLLKEEILARQLGAHTSPNASCDTGGHEQKNYGHGHHSREMKSSVLSKRGGTSTGASLVASGSSSATGRVTPEPKYPCAFCLQNGHFPSACSEYVTPESRIAAMGDRCKLCLAKGHDIKACRKRFTRCRICGENRSHHQSLCLRGSSKRAVNDSTLSVSAQTTSPATAILSRTEIGHRRGRAVMPTALAVVKGQRAERKARIILDTASTQSYARADLLKAIGARRIGTDYLGLAGVQAEARKVDAYGFYEFLLTLADGTTRTMTAHALKNISCPVQKPAIDISRYPVLAKLNLAEPLPDKETEVQLDIMIGLDHYYEIVGTEQIRLDPSIVLLGTKLGYVVTGFTDATGVEQSTESVLIVASTAYDSQLDNDLQRLWRMEDVGCRDDPTSLESTMAKRKFIQSIQYNTDEHRYSVRWPWKVERPDLPDNFGIAYGRLKSLLKRLDESTLKTYNGVLSGQLANNVIEPAPKTLSGPLVHYIPHHCVIRPDKATTKLRIVYDASCKSGKFDLSLNECIYRGPVLLADLCGLLMRFRTHPVALTSDIEKAFLQVGLQPVDRDVTRFLWLKDISKPLTKDNLLILRFARVLFGVIASPYMLGGTIQVHMERVNTPAARQIVQDNYVDNVITGAGTTGDATRFYCEAKKAFRSASMNLREWYSNDAATMNKILPEDRGCGKITSVLGLLWDTEEDTLRCKTIRSASGTPATKRSILKVVASLFDPLGFFAPVMVTAKILLQSVWKFGTGWDEPIPRDAQQKWNALLPDIIKCTDISIPRLCSFSHQAAFQLHCFSDASMEAFGAVVYLRVESGSKVATRLVFAKARVCPLKEQRLTIPRLELAALALGCRVLKFVKQEMRLDQVQLFAWTDSMCAYYWVAEDSENKIAKRPIYVKNKVQDILSRKPFELRYVPTASNPADYLTRGMPASELSDCQQWWQGPKFLALKESAWPPSPATRGELEDLTDGEETAKCVLTAPDTALHSSASDARAKYGRLDPNRFSRWSRLIRITAWTLRFADNARRQDRQLSKELVAGELAKAAKVWIRATQQDFALTHPESFKTTKRELQLFTDSTGVMRCHGRIENADISYDERYPVFLPRRVRPTELIISDIHEQLSHAGVTQTLAALRQQYWVPKGRLEVKRVTQSCLGCKRYKGGPYQSPDPPSLPNFRVDGRQAFACVGMDYLGPLVIRDPRTKECTKCWICLFTCASTRAIHLEVVTDMTADQTLLAIRRFMALYGCPKLIVSDNAKQFKTGEKVLKNLAKDALDAANVQAFFARHGINWKYIVELGPWMGGMYERMVGIVKKALRCALNRQLLSLMELQTVCAEICAVVNSRPLTYLTDEVGDRPLRPCDLITRNRPGFQAVDDDVIDDPDYLPVSNKQADLIQQWKRLEKRANVFWESWHRDYLLALRERFWNHNRRGTSRVRPHVGDVVMVTKDRMSRSTWPLGRIEELILSDDGEIRSARVKLADGTTLQRPVKLLYPLEAEHHTSGQQAVTSVAAWGLESSDSESER